MAAVRAAATTTSSITSRSQIAGRAVHIKIHPRPGNISESRQILRVLERYGEVVMYKHLKVRPADQTHGSFVFLAAPLLVFNC